MGSLRRVDLQGSLMETGLQLSWNPWFGASAEAGQECFEWRVPLCTDQSSTQGQCGFNQRLMKNGRGLEVLSGSGSCSAEHLCSLPSTQSCSPAPSASATHLESCWGDGSSSWLSCRTPMWHWDFGFPVCSSSGVGCPAPQLCPWGAGQPVLDWPFAGSAEILSFHPNQEKAQILKFQNPFKHKA